jgi:hypothetical protein
MITKNLKKDVRNVVGPVRSGPILFSPVRGRKQFSFMPVRIPAEARAV